MVGSKYTVCGVRHRGRRLSLTASLLVRAVPAVAPLVAPGRQVDTLQSPALPLVGATLCSDTRREWSEHPISLFSSRNMPIPVLCLLPKLSGLFVCLLGFRGAENKGHYAPIKLSGLVSP